MVIITFSFSLVDSFPEGIALHVQIRIVLGDVFLDQCNAGLFRIGRPGEYIGKHGLEGILLFRGRLCDLSLGFSYFFRSLQLE